MNFFSVIYYIKRKTRKENGATSDLTPTPKYTDQGRLIDYFKVELKNSFTTINS